MKKRILYCNITYACNNNCEHCISYNVRNKSKRAVSLEDYELLQHRFQLTENDIWTISGGEPTLSPSFTDIIDFCYKVSKHIIVYTNGRKLGSISKSTLDKIERIIVPIYGAEEQHNKYVANNLAYKETMESIAKIIDYDPNKIDLKIILDENIDTEALFLTRDWNILKTNQNFSVTRVLKKENIQCSFQIASRASVIVETLIQANKGVRLYDIPLCLLSQNIQKILFPFRNISVDYDTHVICASMGGHYQLFDFHKETDWFPRCLNCSLKKLCCMVMKNYFCPKVNGNRVELMAE